MTGREQYHEAVRKLHNAKAAMDRAQEVLFKAEDEWHQACIELDRLEDGTFGEKANDK